MGFNQHRHSHLCSLRWFASSARNSCLESSIVGKRICFNIVLIFSWFFFGFFLFGKLFFLQYAKCIIISKLITNHYFQKKICCRLWIDGNQKLCLRCKNLATKRSIVCLKAMAQQPKPVLQQCAKRVWCKNLISQRCPLPNLVRSEKCKSNSFFHARFNTLFCHLRQRPS